MRLRPHQLPALLCQCFQQTWPCQPSEYDQAPAQTTLLIAQSTPSARARLEADAHRWQHLANQANEKALRLHAEADGLTAQAQVLAQLATSADHEAWLAQLQHDAQTAKLAGTAP